MRPSCSVNMLTEECYGVIPLHKQGTFDWHVLLVHHQKGHWGFPKGHANKGEEPHAASERELLEETGLQVVRFFPYTGLHEEYEVEQGKKRVTYFLAEVDGHVIPQLAEIQTAEWFTFDAADKRLTFPDGRDVLRKASALLS